MRKNSKRHIFFISVLTLIMAFGIMSIGTFAEESDSVDKEWWNYRNNEENNGVTDRPTPTSAEESALKWGTKTGEGWSAAPTPPIIINGNLYIARGKNIVQLDKETGAVLRISDEMVARTGFSMNPIVYGDGKLFVQVGNGIIQAMDLTTLKPLWHTENIGGQTVSPITYKKINGVGYIYTGTWLSEESDGQYFCVTTSDDNPATGDEIKEHTWSFTPSIDDETLEGKDTARRGFYWAGSYVNNHYLAVGSDDGSPRGESTETATFYTLNPTTGEIIDQLNNIKGDIRTSVVYDNGFVYFSTKGGILYRVKVDEDGHIQGESHLDLGGMTTASPLVYKEKIYIGVAGSGGQFNPDGGHHFAVVNSKAGEDLSLLYDLPIKGYPQAAALLSTAEEDTDYNGDGTADGRVYLYFTYNAQPGGIYYTYDEPGLTEAPIVSKELFIPPTTPNNMQQFCISPICADREGTLYYKNDSGYTMAVDKNPAYLKGVKVTPSTGVTSWSQTFDNRINFYSLKVGSNATDVTMELTLPDGVTATVNGQPYAAPHGRVTLSEETTKVVVQVSKEGKTRDYTFNIVKESSSAYLSDIKISDFNGYGSGLKSITPDFDKEVEEYTTETLNQSKSFYNLWPEKEISGAKIVVLPTENVDTTRAGYIDEETGGINITATSSGHSRYAIYATDKTKNSKVTIQVTSENGLEEKSYTVVLSREINVSSVTLDEEELSLMVGEVATLHKTIVPTEATNQQVIWSSDDKGVATVDDDGKVTAVGEGKTNITLTSVDGGKTATCSITATSLEGIKATAKATLDSYNLADYAEGQKAEVEALIEAGKVAIEAATTREEIESALSDAKAKIGMVPTAEDIQLEKDTEITVYVSLAKDGTFVVGNDDEGTTLGAVPVKVGYFDLKQYGLEKFYRYEADSFENGGTYINDTIIKKPTVLHLYIRFIEQYYKNGEKLIVGTPGLDIQGSATSMWMQNFYGLGNNLNYYVNNKYPLMREGWGATADYVLLKNNDQVAVGVFSDYGFWQEGASFMHFENTVATVEAGTVFTGLLQGTEAGPNFSTLELPKANEDILVNGTKKTKTSANGNFALTFDIPGTYFVSSGNISPNNNYLVPAAMVVTVTEALDDVKASAKNELENYKEPDGYREEQKQELAEAISTGKNTIDNGTTVDEVEAALTNAKKAIDKIKTNAQLTEEELIQAKINGKAALDNYKEVSEYRAAEQEELANALNTGKAAIDNGTTITEVDEAIEQAKIIMDEIKTDAQLTEEEKVAAATVDTKIEEIGTVTLESKNAIEVARTGYDGLSDCEKAFVTKLIVLEAAELRYQELIDEAAQVEVDKAVAKVVSDLIGDIGVVSLEKEAKIEEARAAYQRLSDKQKAYVTNLHTLENAEETLQALIDQNVAQKVMDEINGIGEITFEKEAVIYRARVSYDGLTDKQKSLVTNEGILIAAEEALAKMMNQPSFVIDFDHSSAVNGEGQFVVEKPVQTDLKVRVLAEIDTLTSVTIDGEVVDPANYKAEEGSIIINFKAGYLNDLTLGVKDLKINTNKGYAEGSILVSEKDTDGEILPQDGIGSGGVKPAKQGESGNVSTGDYPSNWIFGLMIFGLITMIVVKKKRT